MRILEIRKEHFAYNLALISYIKKLYEYDQNYNENSEIKQVLV